MSKTNNKSIVALILGILSLLVTGVGFVLGIIAIVFAKKALNEIKVSGEQGNGFATAGLVCGIIGTVMYGLVILWFVFVISTFSFGP
ncbi:DUF4190 domain-containing protein [Paenibacillus glycanilyticus]|uniref:DUF4190 domain-containing protein n=1 Tax=Paenibacillus glycanilyticus TaxID=126569 RepID=A0ABQ6GFC7_9BACL|nr:DUF4190 domain-containing protein [Paenibacillus glycanilyticus]GLX68036.1 hypothetical protein MU1_23810 [Paenibacillus glycanilyticus]